jgi:hypothetical protein
MLDGIPEAAVFCCRPRKSGGSFRQARRDWFKENEFISVVQLAIDSMTPLRLPRWPGVPGHVCACHEPHGYKVTFFLRRMGRVFADLSRKAANISSTKERLRLASCFRKTVAKRQKTSIRSRATQLCHPAGGFCHYSFGLIRTR